MIIGVIADRMPSGSQFLEPVDVCLLENAAHAEEMNQSAIFLGHPSGVYRIAFRGVVQISLLIVPFEDVSTRIFAAHFQIERNRNLGLFLVGFSSAYRLRTPSHGSNAASQKGTS